MSCDHHHHGPASYSRAFAVGIALNLGFVIVEVIFGLLAHSLALLADSGHNFCDVLALGMAWGATRLSQSPPGGRYTYGLRRSSILAALANAILLLIVTGGIAWEAVQRLIHPEPVAGKIVMAVAALGIVINAATAVLFFSGRKGDLNIRAAFLHMAADALVALGVVVAGAIILMTDWLWIDPLVSLIISFILVAGTWHLLRDSFHLSLDAVPREVSLESVRRFLAALPGVAEVHDLHIWGMSTTQTALTVHLVMPLGCPDDAFLARLSDQLHDQFEIEHATFQVERGDPRHPCALASDHVV